MSKGFYCRLIAASVVLLPLVGCDSATDKTIVSGTVTYQSQALTGGRLALFNSRNEQIGGANINPDGTFIATDLPREELKVTVVTGGGMMAKMQSAPPTSTVIADPAAGGTPVPEKYHRPETSDLKVNASSGSQKVELKLE